MFGKQITQKQANIQQKAFEQPDNFINKEWTHWLHTVLQTDTKVCDEGDSQAH